ncbi:MAG: cryptochrome/photolyase family protein, partial [Phycisphaerae bacterium]|nr:cryptochrome/photolyase family protein [Phycisphaerae bacterium]
LKYYQQKLERRKFDVVYLEHASLLREGLGRWLGGAGVERVRLYDPVDHSLRARLVKEFEAAGIAFEFLESPLFVCGEPYVREYFAEADYSLKRFYNSQRRRLGILVEDGKPAGGQWSYDKENREPMRGEVAVPEVKRIAPNQYVREAQAYVEAHFGGNPGTTAEFFYPVTHRAATGWLADFVERRLEYFGPYEDAISAEERYLFHSLLSLQLNSGLITVGEVLEAVLGHAERHGVRLNSVEGFVRQIIGWREFMRAVYVMEGRRQAESNFWGLERDMPDAFYDGTTGVEPVDVVIRQVRDQAYAHHIERLMILGNFMLLCEIRPQAVYRWFMELFIDAYDWVMTPNVFGMSQYADGGMMTTKPYVSSSNYVRKMSDFAAGPWCEIWDGLFWRFVGRHRKVFAGNPRMKVMAVQLDRMEGDKKRAHVETAEAFLRRLNAG